MNCLYKADSFHDCSVQMKEEELLVANHVGEVMKILSDATHNAYDPDELLKVQFLLDASQCYLLLLLKIEERVHEIAIVWSEPINDSPLKFLDGLCIRCS